MELSRSDEGGGAISDTAGGELFFFVCVLLHVKTRMAHKDNFAFKLMNCIFRTKSTR